VILSFHAPKEDKTDDIKDRFYEELKYVFDKNDLFATSEVN
jgi:hypothetical protein